MGVSAVGDKIKILDNSLSEKSLDNWTRSLGHLSFTKWRMGGWTLDISEG
jgi:hypothetical protein